MASRTRMRPAAQGPRGAHCTGCPGRHGRPSPGETAAAAHPLPAAPAARSPRSGRQVAVAHRRSLRGRPGATQRDPCLCGQVTGPKDQTPAWRAIPEAGRRSRAGTEPPCMGRRRGLSRRGETEPTRAALFPPDPWKSEALPVTENGHSTAAEMPAPLKKGSGARFF